MDHGGSGNQPTQNKTLDNKRGQIQYSNQFSEASKN